MKIGNKNAGAVSWAWVSLSSVPGGRKRELREIHRALQVPERFLSGDYHLPRRWTGSRDGKVGRRYWSQLLLFSTFYPAQPTAASGNDAGDAGDAAPEPAKPQLTSIPHSRANSWLELMTNSLTLQLRTLRARRAPLGFLPSLAKYLSYLSLSLDFLSISRLVGAESKM